MRGAGIDYPDPDPSGKSQIRQIDSNDPRYAAADKDCTATVTKKWGEEPVTDAEKKATEETRKANRELSDCLRKKGYDVPDDPIDGFSGVDLSENDLAACGVAGDDKQFVTE